MRVEDSALLQLADAATRRSIVDDLALESILDAAFVTSGLGVEGPFDATFDEFRLGAVAPISTHVDAGWSALGGGDRVEGRADIIWPPGSGPRTDAVWRGAITARVQTTSGHLESLSSARCAVHSLDDDITPLPTDPVVLEQARREALRVRLGAGAAQPDAVDNALIDRLLIQAGVTTVGELMRRHQSEQATGRMRATFAEARDSPPTPRAFPVAVALLVRDSDNRLVDLLTECKNVQLVLEPQIERPNQPDIRLRNPVVVGLVLPGEVFDDAAWPGAEPGISRMAARLARRAAAAHWLAPEGVVLMSHDPPG
ncbi:hypothetical protein [Nocardia xishanensis]